MTHTYELPKVHRVMVPGSEAGKAVPDVVRVDGRNFNRASIADDIKWAEQRLAGCVYARAYFTAREEAAARRAADAEAAAKAERIDKAAALICERSTGLSHVGGRIPDVYKRMASTLLDAVDKGEL